jgi:mono/diheme cytochrome c family protein
VLLLLAVMLVAGLYLMGSSRLGRTYTVQTAALQIQTDSGAIARGAHLARIHGCTDCHTANLGGQLFEDAPPFRAVASNLTSGEGGVGRTFSAEDFDRAIRHGVRPDGTALFIMPSAAFHNLSDTDAADLIAYLMQVPPVDNVLPATEFRPLGRILAAVAIDPSLEVNTGPARSTSPPPSASAEYGEYLISVTCAYCHGTDLRGMQPPMPDAPLAPDLAAAGRWSFEEFQRALTTGMRPSGVALDPLYMPWGVFAQMTQDELRALHAYLGTLPAPATTPTAQ